MTVGGTKIKVGQIWETRAGLFVKVAGESNTAANYKYVLSDGSTVNKDGRQIATLAHPGDLVDCVAQGTDFDPWNGVGVPAKDGTVVEVILRDGSTGKHKVESFEWTQNNSSDDIVAYRVLGSDSVAEPTTTAEPTYTVDEIWAALAQADFSTKEAFAKCLERSKDLEYANYLRLKAKFEGSSQKS